MVFVIVFNYSLHLPLSYHWGEDRYEACPSCVRAHELRTCDGETKVSFEICERHRDVTKDPTFDYAMLNELRTLMHPLHSPVPKFPISAFGITASSKTDLQKKVKVTATSGCRSNAIAGGQVNPNLRLNGPLSPLDFRPRVKFTYAHVGCVYSSEPDVLIKSRGAMEVMDQYAKERLANITKLLETGVDYELGPDFDVDHATNAEARDGKRASSSNPKEETFSSQSDTVHAVTLSESASEQDDEPEMSPEAAARMIFDSAESEARSLLRVEKTRLEECLATSSLAKGMYFKRCNGQWVSPLGDVFPYGKGRSIAVRIREELKKEQIRYEVIRRAGNLGYWVSYGRQFGQEMICVQPRKGQEPVQSQDGWDEKSILSMMTTGTLSTDVSSSTNTTNSTSATSTNTSSTALNLEEALVKPWPSSKRSGSVLGLTDSHSDTDSDYGYALLRPSDSPPTNLPPCSRGAIISWYHNKSVSGDFHLSPPYASLDSSI